MKPIGEGGRFEGWLYPISQTMNRIASFVLFLMMILTIMDVLGRKLLSHSVTGAVELTEFMLVIVIFFSLAQTEMKNGHVKVDLIMGRFGRRTQAIADMMTQCIGFLLCVVITWSTLIYAGKMRISGEVSQDLWLPKFPFIYVVAVGCGILALALFAKFLVALAKLGKS